MNNDDNPEADVLDPATGQPRLNTRKCSTCVFNPGNPMQLAPGRLADLVERNRSAGAGLTCHQTLTYSGYDAPPAWCRGFYDAYPDTTIFRFAYAVMGGPIEVDPPNDSP